VLLGVGLTHRTAPLAMRERLALPPAHATELLHALLESRAVDEAVAVSTCNRTELYLVGEDAAAVEQAALRALADRARQSPAALGPWLSTVEGGEATAHLFAVAAGLDSMILGEAEILGQLRGAYELASAARAIGPLTDRLLRGALTAGRRVRAGTAIARRGVSVSSAAVELARDALGSLADRRVLLVGAGRSSELTARALAGHGVRILQVANRDRDRAAELAGRYGAAVPLHRLEDHLAQADLVLSATACPDALIDRGAVARAIAKRPDRPLVLVDLAVPRDVDPAVRTLAGVTLLDLDDIQRRVSRNRAVRRGELDRARELVRAEVDRFEAWRAARDAVPTVAALQSTGEAIVAELLDRNASRWESLSPSDRERVASLAHAVARRLLHEPTLRLKQAARGGDPGAARSARELFGLDRPTTRVVAEG
jgi:glutamyl-tRNA reductase